MAIPFSSCNRDGSAADIDHLTGLLVIPPRLPVNWCFTVNSARGRKSVPSITGRSGIHLDTLLAKTLGLTVGVSEY